MTLASFTKHGEFGLPSSYVKVAIYAENLRVLIGVGWQADWRIQTKGNNKYAQRVKCMIPGAHNTKNKLCFIERLFKLADIEISKLYKKTKNLL